MVFASLAAAGGGDITKGAQALGLIQSSAAPAKKREGFQSNAGDTLFFGISLAFMFLAAVSAAVLSWSYNKSLGTPTTLAVLYAVLAFLFHEFYIPLYAFFLNPVGRGGGRRNNGSK